MPTADELLDEALRERAKSRAPGTSAQANPLKRAADQEHQGLWSAFKGGLSKSTGAAGLREYGLTDIPASTDEATTYGEKLAEGAGEMAGSPYLLLGLAGGPAGAAAGMFAEGAHRKLLSDDQAAPVEERLGGAALAGGENALLGLAAGQAGEALRAGTAGMSLPVRAAVPVAGEAATMGAGGEALRAMTAGKDDPGFSLERAKEGALMALPVVGASHGLYAGGRALRSAAEIGGGQAARLVRSLRDRVLNGAEPPPAPDETPDTVTQAAEAIQTQATGPQEGPVNEPGAVPMGVGAESTPPNPDASEAYIESSNRWRRAMEQRNQADQLIEAYRASLFPDETAAAPEAPAPDAQAPAPESTSEAPPAPPPPTPAQQQLAQIDQQLAGVQKVIERYRASKNRKGLAKVQPVLDRLIEARQAATAQRQSELVPEGTPGTPVGPLNGQTVAGPGAPPETPPAPPAPAQAGGEPPPPQPAPPEAPSPTPAPNTGTPETVPESAPPIPPAEPPKPGMASVLARQKVAQQLDKLEQQAHDFAQEYESAVAAGDDGRAQAMDESISRVREAQARIRTYLGSGNQPEEVAALEAAQAPEAPPGEAPAEAPEAPPPPAAEPPAPSVPKETPLARLLAAARQQASAAPPEPTRAPDETLKAMREPIPFQPEKAYTESTEPIRGEYRTRDHILAEATSEARALKAQEQGQPVTEKWVDRTLSPEERQSRLQDLFGELRWRQGLPRPVDEVLAGERGAYARETTGEPDLRDFARENAMGYLRAGAHEVLYNPDAVSESEVRQLAQGGHLAQLVEPDVTGAVAEPGPGGGPPTTPSSMGEERAPARRPPPGREGERGSLFGPRKPVEPKPVDRFENPALEARIAEPKVTTWTQRYHAAIERMRSAWNDVFGFEDFVHPRHFNNDAFFRGEPGLFKEHIEDLELKQNDWAESNHVGIQKLTHAFEPALKSAYPHETLGAAVRVIDLADLMDDVKVFGPDVSPVPQEVLANEWTRLYEHGTPAVRETVDRYHRDIAHWIRDEAIGRKWLPEAVRMRDAYFGRWQQDLTDAAGVLYKGLTRALGEGPSRRWQMAREGGAPEHMTYEDAIQRIQARIVSHELLKRSEAFVEKWLPRFDVSTRMSPNERQRYFGGPEIADAKRWMAANPGGSIAVRDADGVVHIYAVVAPPGPRLWGGVPPGSPEEAALLKVEGTRQAAREGRTSLVPARIANRWERFSEPAAVSEMYRAITQAQFLEKRMMTLAPGFRFTNRNLMSDAVDYWRDAGVSEGQELVQFSGQLARWIASGGKQPAPDVLRVILGRVTPDEPALYDLQRVVREQGIGRSGFMGDPAAHLGLKKLLQVAESSTAAWWRKAGQTPGHLLDAYDMFSQNREALFRVMKAKADYGRMQRGEPITSYTVDVNDLPPEYQIGKVAKALSGNYTRISPAFKGIFRDVVAPFLTWPTWALRNTLRYAYTIGGQGLKGDLKPLADGLVKVGLPLLLAHEYRKKSGDLWDQMEKAGAWFTDSFFAFPLQSQDPDGNHYVFVPSTAFDVAPQILDLQDMGKDVASWWRGEANLPETLGALSGDLVKGIGGFMGSYAAQFVDIPYGLASGIDPRTGKRIAPEELGWDTPTGRQMRGAWVLTQLLPPYAMLQRGLVQAAKHPGNEATGPFRRAIEALLTGPLDPDPRDTFLYTTEESTLPIDAALHQGKLAEGPNAESLYQFRQGALDTVVSGDRTKLDKAIDRIVRRAKAGQLPPDAAAFESTLKSPSFLQDILTAKNMAAATPAERERTRQAIRGLASAGRLESFQRYQKDHPNEALQGLLNLYRDKLDAARPHTGTIQGGQ